MSWVYTDNLETMSGLNVNDTSRIRLNTRRNFETPFLTKMAAVSEVKLFSLNGLQWYWSPWSPVVLNALPALPGLE